MRAIMKRIACFIGASASAATKSVVNMAPSPWQIASQSSAASRTLGMSGYSTW